MQGTRGRIDRTGQRRPIYVIVQTYLQCSGQDRDVWFPPWVSKYTFVCLLRLGFTGLVGGLGFSSQQITFVIFFLSCVCVYVWGGGGGLSHSDFIQLASETVVGENDESRHRHASCTLSSLVYVLVLCFRFYRITDDWWFRPPERYWWLGNIVDDHSRYDDPVNQPFSHDVLINQPNHIEWSPHPDKSEPRLPEKCGDAARFHTCPRYMSIRFLPCIAGSSCVSWMEASSGSSFNSDSSWAWRPKSWLSMTFQTLHEGQDSGEYKYGENLPWVFSARNHQNPLCTLPNPRPLAVDSHSALAHRIELTSSWNSEFCKCQTGQAYGLSMPMCLSDAPKLPFEWCKWWQTAEFWGSHLLDATYTTKCPSNPESQKGSD